MSIVVDAQKNELYFCQVPPERCEKCLLKTLNFHSIDHFCAFEKHGHINSTTQSSEEVLDEANVPVFFRQEAVAIF